MISNDNTQMRKPARKKRKKQRSFILTIGCTLIVILLLLIVWLVRIPGAEKPETETAVSLFTPKPKIGKGIAISGIDVSGLTEQAALEKIQQSISDDIQTTPVVLHYGGGTLTLSTELSEIRWYVEGAVQRAMAGTSSNLELICNKNAILSELSRFFSQFGGVYSPSGFWLEGIRPSIESDESNSQILVLNPGTAGLEIDIESVFERIMQAVRDKSFRVDLEDAGEIKYPRELDLNSVFELVSIAPVNPDIDRTTLEEIPGKPGYGFRTDYAKELMECAAPGELVRVPMEYMEPEMSMEDAWFQDVLGYCKTEINDNENRNSNLRLACSMLNGKILQPGETLSYNQTLGKRTTAAGYLPAPAYSGTELVDEIGGGICQVSSTLYLSALFAEMNIMERRNHGYPANYIPMGLDATVNWGTTDLKIRNDYDFPVKILAEVSDGYVKVKIMGVEQRSYYVKMEYRVDDHPTYAAAFRCRYDRETDEEIYRRLDHTSIYLEEVWCYPGYAQSAVDDT